MGEQRYHLAHPVTRIRGWHRERPDHPPPKTRSIASTPLVRCVDEDLADLSGSPYSRPGVSAAIGDGRSVLAARDRRYDVIHMGFAGTLSANAAAGFVLTENNLYTVEAFQEYFDHLRPQRRAGRVADPHGRRR